MTGPAGAAERGPVDPVDLARTLIDIDSTTGREGQVARVLAGYLRGRGYSVLEQPLPPIESVPGGPGTGESEPRANVIAAVGEPRVVFSTHFDCVPPFIPSRIDRGRLYGRGACDAKGILAAQVAAAERLRAAAVTGIGLLFVAGEERGSDGARSANAIASQCRFLINGEPTDLRLGAATRGGLRVRLVATGRAAHSGYPELGESAIEKLLDVLVSLRDVDWPDDSLLGRTHYTVGLIAGGVAPNVVPPTAQAEVFFRTVGASDAVRERLTAAVAGRVAIEEILDLPVVRLHTRLGYETAVFSYFSDVPFLSRWGTPLLVGPGSIHVAHTDDEHVELDELHAAVDLYERLARELLRE
jgi:acetylornithine deacetylase